MFLMLTQYRQFAEAAENENISQSSLSKQIKALEDEVGTKLFKRTSKGVELTQAGKEFYTFAETSLDAKRNMMLNISAQMEAQSKTTTVGIMPVMTSYGIAELLSDFRKEYPQFNLRVMEKNTREIVRMLAGNALNMALIGTKLADLDKYHEYSLEKDPIILAIAEDHPLAQYEILDLKQLEDEPFIQLENSIGINRIVVDGCKEAGFAPNIAYTCNVVPSALSMVKEGLGVLLFTSKGINVFDTSGIKLLRLRDQLFGDLVLVTSKEYEPNRADVAFREFTLNWYHVKNRVHGKSG